MGRKSKHTKKYVKDREVQGDFGVCNKCRRVFNKKQLTVHHIIPTRYARIIREECNDQNILNGIQKYGILCRACHDEVEELYKLHDSIVLNLDRPQYKYPSVIGDYMTITNRFKNKYSSTNTYIGQARSEFRLVIKRYMLSLYMESVLYYKTIYRYFLEDKIRAM